MPEAEPQGPAEPQPYSGTERRMRDRRHRQPPRVIGLARIRARSYPSLSRDTWYAVIDRNPEAAPAEPLGGYVWLDGRPAETHLAGSLGNQRRS
jgi:hypothetical protein